MTSINTIRHQLWKWVTLQITDLAGALAVQVFGDRLSFLMDDLTKVLAA